MQPVELNPPKNDGAWSIQIDKNQRMKIEWNKGADRIEVHHNLPNGEVSKYTGDTVRKGNDAVRQADS